MHRLIKTFRNRISRSSFRHRLTPLLFVLSLSPCHAQTSDDGSMLTSPSGYLLGLHTGPLLPAKIEGVGEIVPGWGLRATAPTSVGDFEVEAFLGRGDGISYNRFSLDYAYVIPQEFFSVHLSLGIHTDHFSPPNGAGRTAGGWHCGGGASLPLMGDLWLRSDFKFGVSPGQSLYVGLGLVYQFPSGSDTSN